MRLFMCYILLSFCCFGCATMKITTDIGTKIGITYQEAAERGIINAEESITSWPYISGQIKGLLADNYDIILPQIMKNIISDLDNLSKKEKLTDEEKGFIIGSFCRLESLSIKLGWDKYGIRIIEMVK